MRPPPTQPNIPAMRLISTDYDIAHRVHVLMPGSFMQKRPRKEQHHKDAWVVELKGPRAVDAMLRLRPLMGQRRQAAIDAAIAEYRPRRSTALVRSLGLQMFLVPDPSEHLHK